MPEMLAESGRGFQIIAEVAEDFGWHTLPDGRPVDDVVSNMIAVGVHACCRFVDDAERTAVVAAFVEEGLTRGERVAVYTQAGAPSVLDALDVDVDRFIALGMLVTGDVEAAYLPDGRFDGPARAAEFATYTQDTIAAGFPALRVYADNGGIPALLDDPTEWLTYEARVAATVPRYALTGLCGFHADDPPLLSDAVVDALHERSLSAGTRPLPFHLYGRPDGTLALAGELDVLSLTEVRQLLAALRPALVDHRLSLADVAFVDAETGYELHEFVAEVGERVRDVPAPVRQVWRMLGLTA
jgi:hypothetical protein